MNNEADLEEKKRGRRYLAGNAIVFLALFGWQTTNNWTEWKFTPDAVEDAATAGEVTAMVATVWALLWPQGFRAAFAKLIRVIRDIWRGVGSGENIATAPQPRTSASPPQQAAADRQQHETFRDVRWVRPAIAFALIALFAGFLTTQTSRQQGPSHQAPRYPERVEGPLRQTPAPIPIAPAIAEPLRPTAVTITTEGSCEEIAAKYCIASRWRELTTHNKVPVNRRGARWYCEIHQGDILQFPPSWANGCN